MDDMISRQAAIDYFVINVGFHDEDGYPIEDADELRKIWTEYFDGIPSAEPKRGRREMGIDERFVECSECGLMTTRNELRGLAVFGKNEPNFCPNCGADMREATT